MDAHVCHSNASSSSSGGKLATPKGCLLRLRALLSPLPTTHALKHNLALQGDYAVGQVFLPKDPILYDQAKKVIHQVRAGGTGRCTLCAARCTLCAGRPCHELPWMCCAAHSAQAGVFTSCRGCAVSHLGTQAQGAFPRRSNTTRRWQPTRATTCWAGATCPPTTRRWAPPRWVAGRGACLFNTRLPELRLGERDHRT